VLKDGRRIYVIGQGRLVNLAAAEGHPSEVMDMSFANQFLGMVHMAAQGKKLEVKVHDIPRSQDLELASVKLATMGLQIDSLTAEQLEYANSYLEGT
jgi:adenosylhomocysteinase